MKSVAAYPQATEEVTFQTTGKVVKRQPRGFLGKSFLSQQPRSMPWMGDWHVQAGPESWSECSWHWVRWRKLKKNAREARTFFHACVCVNVWLQTEFCIANSTTDVNGDPEKATVSTEMWRNPALRGKWKRRTEGRESESYFSWGVLMPGGSSGGSPWKRRRK